MKCKWIIPAVAALLFSLSACKKPVDDTPVGDPILSVKLNAAYLGTANIDSAFAIWEKGNTVQRIEMDVRNDSLLADMKLFNEGDGKLTIQVFSNKKFRWYNSQWIFKKNIAIQKTKGQHYAGPATFFDAAWFPRAEIKDGIGHSALVGLRPEDSYFLVRDLDDGIVKLEVDKSYWKTIGGIAMAGRGIWECADACLTPNEDVEDDDYFDFMSGRIGTKPWNHISIVIRYHINEIGEGWIIDLEYDL